MKKSIRNRTRVILLGIGSLLWTNASGQNGEELFNTHCAVCHKVTSERFVGPGMAGITDKRSADWLKSWIKDSQGLIASGDADAKAVFEEYNSSVMPPFGHLADADIDAMIDYLGTLGGGEGAEGGEEVAVVDVNYTDEETAKGKKYFTGEERLFNGGPSCITCHNVTDEGVHGGYLAKDLTDVYIRLGETGISSMIKGAPFPAMRNAYENNPVTQEEMKTISAYLKSVSTNVEEDKTSSVLMFTLLSVGGFIVFLIIIMGVWSRRKKDSTKEDIFARQLKSVN